MLRNRHVGLLSLVFLVLSARPGGASDHFFPRLKPLFVGLDESKVPAASRSALAQAKDDFQLARHGQSPCHAHYVSTLPFTRSQVFEGCGYRLTLVNKNLVHTVLKGPEIVLDSSITGAKPCRYDEVDRLGD